MTDIVERLLKRVLFEAAVDAYKLMREASAEIERLRLSLSEARATGRREGMESMISWHAKEIERLGEQIAENDAYCLLVGNKYVSQANAYCDNCRKVHEQSIAAIRAAMESFP